MGGRLVVGLICGIFGDLLKGEGDRRFADVTGCGERAVKGAALGVRSKAPCDVSDADRAGELERVTFKGLLKATGLLGAEFTEFALEVADWGREPAFTMPVGSILSFCSNSKALKSSVDFGLSTDSMSFELDMCSEDISSS